MTVSRLRSLYYIKGYENPEKSHLLRWIQPMNDLFYLHMCIFCMMSGNLQCPNYKCDPSSLRFYTTILVLTLASLGKDKLNYFAMDCLLQHVTEALVLVAATWLEGVDFLAQLRNILLKNDSRTTIQRIVELFG